MHRIGLDLSGSNARFAWEEKSKKSGSRILQCGPAIKWDMQEMIEIIIGDTGSTIVFVVGNNREYEDLLGQLTPVRFHGNQLERLLQTRAEGMRQIKKMKLRGVDEYATAIGALFYGR